MLTPPKVFRDVVSQPEAVSALLGEIRREGKDIHHAWLFTGPPGSGRSQLALAFAAALLCSEGGCGTCNSCQMIQTRNHPDVQVLNTERVLISVDEVTEFIEKSIQMPAIGRFRIMVIEDADRMSERTSNLLLKSLEEPPKGTIWMICAPSEADLLPTIRSRVRRVQLKVPTVDAVAQLLVEKYGIAFDLAQSIAAQAQSHVGMARRLATNAGARERRTQALKAVLSITDIPSAMYVSETLAKLAESDGAQLTAEQDDAERKELLISLGVSEESKLNPSSRAAIRRLEEAQKKRATRSKRDGLDRVLIDLMGLYRDVLTIQLGTGGALINADLVQEITKLANESTQAQSIHNIEQIEKVRYRMDRNVKDNYLLDSLAVGFRRKAAR
ncbi:MAG: DNA polymerase III subunit delta' [Rhodoluna sp.]|nr:DNA polymerase III subunit delta' [Rhodoluna sp.]